jgi:hypothetical protein
MNKYPLKPISKTTALREAEPDAVELAASEPRRGGFFSFRYSYTEVTSQGDRTRVKARQVRLEDGKVSNEAFEGELDGRVYDETARQAQQLVLEQAGWFLRSLSWLLPPMRGARPDRD